MRFKFVRRQSLSIAIIIVTCVFILSYFESTRNYLYFRNEVFYSTLEVSVAVVILLVSYMLTISKQEWEYNLSGLIVGFVAMGVFNLFHGSTTLDDSSIFMQSMASMFGGIAVLSTIFFKKHGFVKKVPPRVVLLIGVFSAVICVSLLVFEDIVPAMHQNYVFSRFAASLSTIVGVINLICARYFFLRQKVEQKEIDTLFYITTLFVGISSIAVQVSQIWSISWWLWHVLRLTAYLMYIRFILLIIEKNRIRLEEKNLEIIAINKKLNDYTYIISHDLKEPIRSIRTFSEFIMEDYEEKFDETAKDYFSRIITASTRMANMISDLLVLSQIGKTDVQFIEVSLEAIINDVTDQMEDAIKKSKTIVTLSNMRNIHCQPVWMKTVFSNLIGNAIKYSDEMKEETTIHISVEEFPESSRYHLISVSDNGIGIDASQHEKVFGLFRRATREKNRDGSGAGLAIVKSVVEEHGGRIWIEKSELGIGTTICFTLEKKRSVQ